MFVRLIGGVAIGDQPDEVRPIPGTVASTVLAVLAMSGGRAVSIEQLTDAVWDEAPQSTKNAIQVAVSRLRERLGRDAVDTVPGGYRLDAALARVDLLEFEQAVATARELAAAGRWEDSLHAAEYGMGIIRAEPVAGAASEWVRRLRERTADRATEARLLRGRALTTLGRPSDALDDLRSLVDADPLDERAAVQLAECLALLGRKPDALAVHETLRAQLAEALGADPSPSTQQALVTLLTDTGPVSEPSAATVRLPVLPGPTWGRDEVVEELHGMLGERRMVTIIGPGGMGKTRVAVLTAARHAAAVAGSSAWFVDLAPCGDALQIADALDSAIDPDSSDHRATLASGRHLVVLDNAEHLIDEVASAATSLLEAGDVRVVVTSRRPLGVRDERLYWLEELESGGPEAPATQLLVDRARTWLSPDAEEIATIARLAQRVDGVPLAVELVAAALCWRSPAELLEELDVELLEGAGDDSAGRHATVTAALDWNLTHIDDEALAALGALLVFEGDFSLAAATAVVASAVPRSSARRAIAQLVDVSLVQRRSIIGEVRLRLLEPVKIAARHHPLVPRETRIAAEAHARFHLQLVVGAVDALETTDAPAVAIHRADDHNVTAAVEWAWEHIHDDAVDCLGHAMYYWYYVVREASMMRWLETMQERHGLDSPAGARCGIAVIMFRTLEGRPEETELIREVVRGQVAQLDPVWQLRWAPGEAERLRLLERDDEARAIWDSVPEPRTDRGRASKASFLCMLEIGAGRFVEAGRILDEVLAARLSVDQPSLHSYILSNRAYVAVMLDDRETAERLSSEALTLARASRIRDDFVLVNNVRAWLALRDERWRDALEMVAESAALLRTADDRIFSTEVALVAALALEHLSSDETLLALVAFLRQARAELAPGVIDVWALRQLDALLARSGTDSNPAPTFERVVELVAQP